MSDGAGALAQAPPAFEADGTFEGMASDGVALLEPAPHPALDAMVRAVNPRARCEPATPAAGAVLAWEIVVDAAAEPAAPPPEVAMVAATGTARFAFRTG